MKKIVLSIMLLLMVLVFGCKEDEVGPKACIGEITETIYVGKPFTFSNCSADGLSYKWMFSSTKYPSKFESTEKNPTITFDRAAEYDVVLYTFGEGDSTSVTTTIEVSAEIGEFVGEDCNRFYNDYLDIQPYKDGYFLSAMQLTPHIGYSSESLATYEMAEDGELILKKSHSDLQQRLSNILLFDDGYQLLIQNSIPGSWDKVLALQNDMSEIFYTDASIKNSQIIDQSKIVHTGRKGDHLWLAIHDTLGVIDIDTTFTMESFSLEGYYMKRINEQYFIICSKTLEGARSAELVTLVFDTEFNLLEEIDIGELDAFVKDIQEHDSYTYILTEASLTKLDKDYKKVNDLSEDIKDFTVSDNYLYTTSDQIISKFDENFNLLWERGMGIRYGQIAQNSVGELLLVGIRKSCFVKLSSGQEVGSDQLYAIRMSKEGDLIN